MTLANDWWRGALIYQVYPRSFKDANGDGVGDLAGIIERLPYIADLGVDAVWLSPIFTSPMKDFGYDVSNYRDIDPLFGTLSAFDELVAKAHSLNLKVMIDQVLSHTSDQHAWFKESRASRNNPKANWYIWADANADGSPPNNWLSVFSGSAWTWDSRRKQYYLHNFLAEQPDLNFHNPEVQDQVLSDLVFWLDRGVDGFRFDTANYFHHDTELRANPPVASAATDLQLPANPYEMQRHVYDKNRPENLAFFERVRKVLDAYGAASVGEVGDAEALDLMVDYTSGGNRLHMTYSFAFLNKEGHADWVRRHARDFETAAARAGGLSWPCWSVGNHDSMRVLSRWEGLEHPKSFTRMVAAMLSCMRGSVCWYQGDELSLPEVELPFEALQDPPGIALWPEYKGRDGCRTPMPWESTLPHAGFSPDTIDATWLPVGKAHYPLAVDQAQADPDAALHFVRGFWTWRRTQPALVGGDVTYLDSGRDVMALIRHAPHNKPSQSWLCVFNMAGRSLTVDMADWPAHEASEIPELPDYQAGLREGEHLTLPPYGIYLAALSV